MSTKPPPKSAPWWLAAAIVPIFVLLAACGGDDAGRAEDATAPDKDIPPGELTLEDLADWTHEILPEGDAENHWGVLPSAAHAEKSLRDCCVDFLKIDPPENVMKMTKDGEFYLEREEFDVLSKRVAEMVMLDMKTMRTTDPNSVWNPRVKGGSLSVIDIDGNRVSFGPAHKWNRRVMLPTYTTRLAIIPRLDSDIEYTFSFRPSDGRCTYVKRSSFED